MTNSFRMRKYLARVFLPILTVWLCVMPAHAWVGPVASLAMRLGASAEFATAVEVSTILHGAVIGMFLPYLEVSNPATGEAVRLPMTVSLPVPAPSAPPTATQSTQTMYTFGLGTPQTSWEAACADIGGTYIAYNGQCIAPCNQFYTSGCESFGGPTALISRNGTGGPVTVCPAGYTASGSSCLLSNARQAAPDNKCDFQRTSSALAMLSDPDCSSPTVADMLKACQSYGANCSFDSRDIPGTAMRMGAAINAANGGTDITVQMARQSGNTSLIDTTTVSVDGTGHVTSVNGGTQTGSISVDAGTGQYQVNGTGNVVTASFPSDYAKSGEATTAANVLGTKLDSLHGDLSNTTNTTDPTEPTVADMPGWGNTFTNLVSWQLPAHSGTCPTPSLDLSNVLGAGKVFVMNSHCTLINDHFNALQAAMTVVWSVLALFIVLRA